MAEPSNLDSFFMQPSGAQSTAPVGAPAPAASAQPPSAPPAAQSAPATAPTPIPSAYQQVGTFYPPAQTAPPGPAPAVPEVMPQLPAPASVPPPTPAAPQPTQQQVSDALQAAQQLGIDVGRFKDGADLVNTMWATVQAMNQELEQQRAQYQAMIAQQAGQAPGQPAPSVPPTPEGFKWDMPQYDPAWDQYPDDPTMQAAKRQYMQARNKTADRVLSQFPDLVKQVVGPELAQARQQMQEAIKQEIAQYRYDQQVEAMESELKPHLYQTDLFGRQTLTPWGEKITSTVRAYVEQGVQDPLWVMQQAKAIVGPPPGSAQQIPAQVSSPVAAASAGVPAQVPGAPTAGQVQPGSVLPGTNFQVVPVTTIQLRGPDGRIVSPAQLSEQQKQAFLAQAAAARATHVPQVGTTPADIQSRPITEADLANWFLPQAG